MRYCSKEIQLMKAAGTSTKIKDRLADTI